ncbi:MAG: acyl-CoA dehydrogenase family protein [Actinobacteria bacterium]|nr:acyl-CoA dehydrogenase family protein [Actinomycetota bacterium]MBV9253444.1 acyl-CoA dehydrogenase family protein [Actinomycetota bacterium]
MTVVAVEAEADADVEQWLDANWSPELSVAEWWQRLADARLAHPMLPEPWGRGWTPDEAARFAEAMVRVGGLGPPSGLGLVLAAPTLLVHGSPDLQQRLVPRILNGQDGWCQLFSEPGAGSDLAGLQTRAERDGDEWVITGQKVWTSLGQWADYGMLLARTDPAAPKHQGISYFAFPMRQPGVEVRPLREMTGRVMFNEVFIDEARVPAANVVGDLGDGWRVANTTLMVERGSAGGGVVAAPCAAIPGSIADHLGRDAGSFAGAPGPAHEGVVDGDGVRVLIDLARHRGSLTDPTIRQDIARLHSLVQIAEWHVARMQLDGAANGGGNLAKLRNSEIVRQARDLGCRILGPHAALLGADVASGGFVQELTMMSPAPSIYGGSDQIQRNIIGERVLGLPKEPKPSGA